MDSVADGSPILKDQVALFLREEIFCGRLPPGEIIRLVNRYIGVSNGYLGDFSRRGLEEFYPESCRLDLNLHTVFPHGATRERYIAIL